MDYKIEEIDLHITDFCSCSCPNCYATRPGMVRKHGDLDTLKLIVHNAIANGGVKRFVMVGGDPCEYPHLIELLRYIREEGSKYRIETEIIVLSNTHDYRENGKIVPIEYAAQFVDEMDVTIHGANAEKHDAYNHTPGSYNHVVNNLNRFARVKNDNQTLCAVLNLIPSVVSNIEEIMQATIGVFHDKLDSFFIQRIVPEGRAEGDSQWFIRKEDISTVMEVLHRVMKEKGKDVNFCDVLPWCIVDEKYWDMLNEGGCNWGTEVLAAYMDGKLTRCAMSQNGLSKKMTELDTPEKWNDFWNNDPSLVAFRNKTHLDNKCKKCELLARCGGSCVLARESGDPYIKTINVYGNPLITNKMLQRCLHGKGRDDLAEKTIAVDAKTGKVELSIPTDFSIGDSGGAGHDYLRR